MTNKRSYNFLIFACFFVWIIMMGSKNIYTAEYIEISSLFQVDKPQASLAMTFYFITYALTQIILFFYMDKINVKWYMLISVFLSGIVTVIIAIATSLWQLWWILAINGILQAGIWGMCTAVLNKYLPIQLKAKANMVMNIGTAISGIISYGSASLFISFKTIASPFAFFGIVLSISAIIFYVAVSKCAKLKSADTTLFEQSANVKQITTLPFTLKTSKTKNLFYVVSFLFSIIIHFVFYGTLNWIPNLLQENFNLPENLAIIISVLAPLATMLGPIFAINHCERNFNFIRVGLLYSIVATVFALMLVFLYNFNIIFSLAILIVYLIIIQGIVTIVFSVISYKLSDYINAGAHSGLMNAAGGISAGIAPPIIGAIIENFGWQISYLSILLFTLFITVCTALILAMLNKRKKSV